MEKKKNSGRFACVYGGRTRTIALQTGVKPWFFTIMCKTSVRNYYVSNSIFLHWRQLATDMILDLGLFDTTVDGNINWTVDVWNLRRAPSGTRLEPAGTYNLEALK